MPAASASPSPARYSTTGSTTSSSLIAAGSMSGSCPASAGGARASRRWPRTCRTRFGAWAACRSSPAAGCGGPAAPHGARTVCQRPTATSIPTRPWMSPGATRRSAATTGSSPAATIPAPLLQVRAHENGAVESHNGHLETALDQALILRGGRDFATVDDYRRFVDQLVGRRNRRREDRIVAEMAALRPLPARRTTDFTPCGAVGTPHPTVSGAVGTPQPHERACRPGHPHRRLPRSPGLLQRAGTVDRPPCFTGGCGFTSTTIVSRHGSAQPACSATLASVGARTVAASTSSIIARCGAAWERVFPDKAITIAAIDRLVHHATILEMNTESYRRRAAVRRKADDPPTPPTTTTDSLTDNHEGKD